MWLWYSIKQVYTLLSKIYIYYISRYLYFAVNDELIDDVNANVKAAVLQQIRDWEIPQINDWKICIPEHYTFMAFEKTTPDKSTLLFLAHSTAQKMKFFIKDFFSILDFFIPWYITTPKIIIAIL